MKLCNLVPLVLVPFLGLLLAASSPAWATSARDRLAGPNDRQITAIVSATNSTEILAGKYVGPRSEDNNVKAYAEQMVDDHTAANKNALDLASKLKFSPEKCDTSRSLEKDGRKNIDALRKLSGHELDKAYLQQEVTAHQAALDTIDRSLLPNVGNGELKALLEQTRSTVADHLEDARRLAATM